MSEEKKEHGPGLVLEGGTFRPIFSCGVMDALLEENIMFPYCIGVSAGISDAVSYVSRQKGRNLEIAKRFRNDKRYFGLRNFRSEKSLFGLNFVFGEIPEKHVPFNYDTYYDYTGRILIGVTNALNGKAEYLDGLAMDRQFSYLRATCAIPLVFPAMSLNGIPYYDGGIADPIPVRKSVRDGNSKNLIILTRPQGYIKAPSRSSVFAARKLHKKYPYLAARMLHRHSTYNNTVAYCEHLAAQGKAVILRPAFPLESFEKNVATLTSSYRHGYQLARKNMSQIKELFDML